MEHDLTIIPVLNKIDLPGAEPEKYAAEIGQLVGVDPDEVLRASGKTGQGVPDLLDHVVVTLPPPHGPEEAPCRAILFDSVYDTYRGLLTTIRHVAATLPSRQRRHTITTGPH